MSTNIMRTADEGYNEAIQKIAETFLQREMDMDDGYDNQMSVSELIDTYGLGIDDMRALIMLTSDARGHKKFKLLFHKTRLLWMAALDLLHIGFDDDQYCVERVITQLKKTIQSIDRVMECYRLALHEKLTEESRKRGHPAD